MIADFMKILGGDDLPTLCLSFDTTYEMGDFYVSVLTYRQTEFVNTPVVPHFFYDIRTKAS